MSRLLSRFCFLFAIAASTCCSAAAYQNYFLPIYQRYLSSMQTDGQVIELDDGSMWRVNGWYTYTVYSWRTGDVLEISPTYAGYGDRFWISNKTLGSHISAELSAGPIVNNPATNHVISSAGGVISLMSVSGMPTRFLVDGRDLHLSGSWLPNQAVIIGKENSFWSNWFGVTDVILINIEQNIFVRAKHI